MAVIAARHASTLLGAPVDGALLVVPLRDAANPSAPDASYAAALARAAGLDGIHPNFAETTPEAITLARSLGLAVRPWTVNDRCEMRRLIDLAVDAIITDDPDDLVDEITNPSSCP